MNRQKNDSMNSRKIVRRNTHSSVSTYVRETLPIDLIIEIVSRLPVNSIAICRFVSKEWASILQRPDFTESFLTKSPPRPRLLFTFIYGSKWHFFSSPQPQNFGNNFSVVATEYRKVYSGSWNNKICQSVNGFIYLNDKVCNPCTGQHITLPKVGTGNVILKCFFGYDPIRKQFKVLCWSKFYRQQITSNEQYQVLTLGTGELLWRKMECSFPHDPQNEKNGICINGVLYYIASMKYWYNGTAIIVCFDVRSEKFSFIETELREVWSSILLEYKGKLGVLLWSDYSTCAELWVLDDTKKVKWSKHKYVLPYTSEEVKKSIWATDTGELVWASSSGWKHPLYVNYYNLESKIVRRLEIKGTKDKESLLTFTNYVENMMFLQQH